MGYPISSLVANLFTEEFESKAINLPPKSHRLCLRYVDDTFVTHRQIITNISILYYIYYILYINSIDPQYSIPMEAPNSNGSIPLLGYPSFPGPNNTLLTYVYRKTTNVDQYLHWDNHHSLFAKYSVFNTLTYRARIVCTNQQLLWEEEGTHYECSS